MDRLHTDMLDFLQRHDMPKFFGGLIRMVARGEPVALDDLAAEVRLPTSEVEAWLRGQPGTDWAEDGRLLGFALTQRPTTHRFLVDDRTLYAFCAADTLMFSPILRAPARVESTCPATGQPITVEMSPTSVISVSPPTAVVSQLFPREVSTDIRSAMCDKGHFFASPDAASGWARHYPDGDVRAIDEFFDTGRGVLRELRKPATVPVA